MGLLAPDVATEITPSFSLDVVTNQAVRLHMSRQDSGRNDNTHEDIQPTHAGNY
jgi:hypothetical protein